ncbi:MAG: type IV-A pilus assembly ATPase PilB [Gammaproteobacteria bacterium]|nr:type IV-A pilus assembly ATPase PilB [Gammaproteobacteria bacterium]
MSARNATARETLARARDFGVPALDLGAFDLGASATGVVDEALVGRHRVLPLVRRGRRLHVALADPADARALDEIKFQTGLDVEPVLVEPDALAAAIDRLRDREPSAPFEDLEGVDHDVPALELESVDADRPDDEQPVAGADDAPVVRFVHGLLLEAVRAGASDVHLEPYERSCRVRFRTDGILREVRRPPRNLAARLAARLKVMAGLDIAERRVPQDGRIRLRLGASRAADFRVNTLPTLFGEKVVLRILDASSARVGIDELGFEPEQEARYRAALRRPQGMVLVTGPTGSGKTVTLYAGLQLLNEPGRNIATVEDPVEMHLEGVNQVHVNHRVGLDFAVAMRAFLRQDPDVLMVGEVRDLETAEVAVKAAQTGHLVLSTLHTNSAAETLTRLRNMGVAAFNVATSVSLVIAQRLARRLCPRCRRRADVPEETLLRVGFSPGDIDGGLRLFEADAAGCAECRGGYRGRVGIYEVMELTPELARVVMDEGDSLRLAAEARRQGFEDLRRSGLRKAMTGVTSLAEIHRITG